MRNAFLLSSVAALGIAGQAVAQDSAVDAGAISYSYLEANYISADIDGLPGSDPDGFGINGSLSFTPMLHGYIDYNNLDYSGFTVQTWEVGVGLNHSLSSMVDLVGRLGYARAKIESLGSDDGLGVQAGLRGRPSGNFEVEGLVHYVDLDDGGDNTSLKAAARYFFMPAFSVGVGIEYDDDATSTTPASATRSTTKERQATQFHGARLGASHEAPFFELAFMLPVCVTPRALLVAALASRTRHQQNEASIPSPSRGPGTPPPLFAHPSRLWLCAMVTTVRP